MVPLSKVQDLIKKHAKLEKELSSEEIDKNSLWIATFMSAAMLDLHQQ